MSTMYVPVSPFRYRYNQRRSGSVSPRDAFFGRVAEDEQAVIHHRRYMFLKEQIPNHFFEEWVGRGMVEISRVPYQTAIVSVLDGETVFVRLSFTEDINVDLQYHCDGDAFVAIYRNNESVFAGSGTVSGTVADLTSYLFQK